MEKFAVHSELFWKRKFGKCDSGIFVIIVKNFSAVFGFKMFAVFFLRVNLPELKFHRWKVLFQIYFLSTLARNELRLCTVYDTDL